MLFNSRFSSETVGKGGVKGGVDQVHSSFALWIRQNFNDKFRQPKADGKLCPRWTLEHATALPDEIKTASVKARPVCEPIEWSENPIMAVVTRLQDAGITTSTNMTELFTSVLARSKTVNV